MEMLRLTEALLVAGWKQRRLPKQEKERQVPDLAHSGHPVTAVSPDMLQHAVAIICKVQWITTQQPALSLSISKESVS